MFAASRPSSGESRLPYSRHKQIPKVSSTNPSLSVVGVNEQQEVQEVLALHHEHGQALYIPRTHFAPAGHAVTGHCYVDGNHHLKVTAVYNESRTIRSTGEQYQKVCTINILPEDYENY